MAFGIIFSFRENILRMTKKNYPVIFCVGTPKISGDSLGPSVGDRLKSAYHVPAYVYGTSASPVTGLNFRDYLEHVRLFHPGSVVIAVDACLGSKEEVGKIKYSLKGLRAGTALKKELGSVGDVAFLGIVAESGKDNFRALTDADKDNIDILAEKIASKIFLFCSLLRMGYTF